jgi:primosomal protein N' (replication factor Y)
VRIDRDITRRKGVLTASLASARSGSVPILVGTQMLAKGHDFPGVTLVAVVDADSQLFSVDLRAGERLLQLIVQVAGRAGRGEQPGQVIIQTHHPDHVLFRTLLRDGYAGASAALLEERRLARLPPYVHLALLRAEASIAAAPELFLQTVAACALKYARNSTEVLGPLAAPMARRAGRYRAHLLMQDARRPVLHALLEALVPQIEALPLAHRVRWSLDVDPAEFY